MRAALAPTAILRPMNRLPTSPRADIFQRAGEKTPAFVRFSTVAGNKGSPDLARDVRGFAVKFYTKEGNWDIVGNNIPVFFIQDAIKFPDLIHAAKQEPDRDFPQAQTAHDNFWDFISLTPGKHAHDHVDHVRPGHPALVPLHGRLWRTHLPAASTPKASRPSSSSTGSRSSGCNRSSGTRRSKSTAPIPTSIAAISGTPSRAATFRNGSCGLQLFDEDFADNFDFDVLDADQDHSRRRCCRSGRGRPPGAGPHASTISSPRPSRSRSARRTSCPGSTSPMIRCCRAATSPISTRS